MKFVFEDQTDSQHFFSKFKKVLKINNIPNKKGLVIKVVNYPNSIKKSKLFSGIFNY